MNEFAATVTERPAIRCGGMKVRTVIQKSGTDCPALWQNDFGPRMESFPADPALAGESYGASVMIDDEQFDYWALMPLAAEVPAPDGMDIFTLPAGTYARVEVPNLAKLANAIDYVGEQWVRGQDAYAIDLGKVWYELYRYGEFCTSGKFAVFCPLITR